MGKTNYIVSIVKILEDPKQTIFNKKTSVTKLRVQFCYNPKVNNYKIIHLISWGSLSLEIAEYYQVNDYLLIEGYVSLNKNENLTKFEITVSKVYPFLLSQNRQISKK